jgi:hypothetical protein
VEKAPRRDGIFARASIEEKPDPVVQRNLHFDASTPSSCGAPKARLEGGSRALRPLGAYWNVLRGRCAAPQDEVGQPILRLRRAPKARPGRCLARRSRYCRGPRRAPPEQRARGGQTKEWRATFA